MNESDSSAGGTDARDPQGLPEGSKLVRRLAALGAALVLALGSGAAIGCGGDDNDQGPAEEAGETVGEGLDEAGETIGEGVEEGAQELDENVGDEDSKNEK